MHLSCQAFGCLASMFVISPKLTGLMAVVVTAVVTVGSAFGSVLRQLSRTSQAQVCLLLLVVICCDYVEDTDMLNLCLLAEMSFLK